MIEDIAKFFAACFAIFLMVCALLVFAVVAMPIGLVVFAVLMICDSMRADDQAAGVVRGYREATIAGASRSACRRGKP